jgi:hypothetical protein
MVCFVGFWRCVLVWRVDVFVACDAHMSLEKIAAGKRRPAEAGVWLFLCIWD